MTRPPPIKAVVVEQQSSLGAWQVRFDLETMRLEARATARHSTESREAIRALTPPEAEALIELARAAPGRSRTVEPFLFQPVTQTVMIQRGRRRVRLSCRGGTLGEVDQSAAALHAHGAQWLRAALPPDAPDDAPRGDDR